MKGKRLEEVRWGERPWEAEIRQKGMGWIVRGGEKTFRGWCRDEWERGPNTDPGFCLRQLGKWWYHFLSWRTQWKGQTWGSCWAHLGRCYPWSSVEHPVEMWSTNALAVFLCSSQFLSIINNIAMNNIPINMSLCSLWQFPHVSDIAKEFFFLNVALIYYIYPSLSPDLNLKSLPKLSSHSFPHCLSYKHFRILGTMLGTKDAK